MKVAIIDFHFKTEEYFSQEMAGGYGYKTWAGNTLLARLLTSNKKRIKFPVIILAYLAAILRNNGHEVVVVNNEHEIQNADLYLLHSSIVNFRKEIELCKLIRERSGAKIGIIGPFCSFKPEIYKNHVDFIIQGEPENAINEIRSADRIPKGLVKSLPVDNLDELPIPDWKYFEVGKYTFEPVLKKKPFLEMSASRGCSSSCNYCHYKAYYGNYRGRSLESVIREITCLVDKFNIRSLLFRDSNFTYRKEWSVKLANKIIERGLDFEWSCETRLDMLDKKMLDLFRKSGLKHIGVGIESYDEKMLRESTRLPIKKKHQEEMLGYCKEIGISVLANYIIGFVGDSEENIKKTIKYARQLNTAFATFNIMTPYPGTIFYEKNKDRIYEEDFEKFTGSYPVFEVEGLSRERLLSLLEKAYISYYYRPAWLFRYGWRYR